MAIHLMSVKFAKTDLHRKQSTSKRCFEVDCCDVLLEMFFPWKYFLTKFTLMRFLFEMDCYVYMLGRVIAFFALLVFQVFYLVRHARPFFCAFRVRAPLSPLLSIILQMTWKRPYIHRPSRLGHISCAYACARAHCTWLGMTLAHGAEKYEFLCIDMVYHSTCT